MGKHFNKVVARQNKLDETKMDVIEEMTELIKGQNLCGVKVDYDEGSLDYSSVTVGYGDEQKCYVIESFFLIDGKIVVSSLPIDRNYSQKELSQVEELMKKNKKKEAFIELEDEPISTVMDAYMTLAEVVDLLDA